MVVWATDIKAPDDDDDDFFLCNIDASSKSRISFGCSARVPFIIIIIIIIKEQKHLDPMSISRVDLDHFAKKFLYSVYPTVLLLLLFFKYGGKKIREPKCIHVGEAGAMCRKIIFLQTDVLSFYLSNLF